MKNQGIIQFFLNLVAILLYRPKRVEPIALPEKTKRVINDIITKKLTPYKISHYKGINYWYDPGLDKLGVAGANTTFPKYDIYFGTTEYFRLDMLLGCAILVHELTHIRQCEKFGKILYGLLKWPLIRRVTIEVAAVRNEKWVLNNSVILGL